MDEMSFYLAPQGDLVLAEKGKPVYDVSAVSDKENIMVSMGVSALGNQVPSFIVYKYVRLPASAKRSAPYGWAVGSTESGWMTARAFFEYFTNTFIPWLKCRNIKLPVAVFFDGHKSHISLPLSEICLMHEVILVYLIAQATHILQPLDISFIKALKSFWKTEVHIYRLEHKGRSPCKEDIPKLIQKILDKLNFSSTSQNGFRKCGIFPFDPDAVNYSKCTKDVSVEEKDELSTSTPLPVSSFMQLKVKLTRI